MGAPIFMQSIPDNGDWTLVNPDKRTGQLTYEDKAGNRIIVPSIWYNQPVSWRVDYFRFCAERARAGAIRLRSSPDKWEAKRADDLDKQAAELEAQAAEMEMTGRFVESAQS